MEENTFKITVRINGEDVVLEGEQAEKVLKYDEYQNEIERLDLQKKDIQKLLRSAAFKMDSLFTDSQKRFNEKNTIEVLDITGNNVKDKYEFKVKADLKAKAIDKKALIGLIADGLQDGWITINSEAMITYLLGQQHAPALEIEQLDENISSIDFVELINKTRDIPKSKEDIIIETEKEN